MIRDVIRPARLQPGDAVRVIAPSGPVFQDAFAAGAAVLSARYQLRYEPATLFACDGFLAGPDDLRLASLIEAIRDPEARAIFMGRGGHGLLRIASGLDLALLRRHPKLIVGFSDGTVLLARAARAGVAAIHGPVVTQLGRLPDEDKAALFSLLESAEPGPLLGGLECLCPGSARGPLLGGNLEVFSHLLGTPLLPDLDGAILFLEEVGERPYRMDRLLTHLTLAGVFAAVAGVVVGDLVACEEPAGSRVASPSAIEVVRERLGRLSIPVVLGAHIGHGERNLPLPYGVRASLDAQAGTLVALETAASK
jgi:muramoyltetrapeptide carboxypeptidase